MSDRRLHPPMFLRLYDRSGWIALLAALGVALLAIPLLNLGLPEDSPLHFPDYGVALLGKIMCYAMLALAMDLVWGYTGILSLGHGIFFALGGYVFGMYLMRQIGHDGSYHSDLPDFMVFLDWKDYPWYWRFTDHFAYALALALLVPGLLALVFGFFAFRSRIKGVYFSIITQAMTVAFMLLFFRNETGFGGNNGFTDFKRILGFPIATAETRMVLFAVTALALAGVLLLGRAIVTSKFGRVLMAIRDAESRVMFLGYNPLVYKLAIWTFSAVIVRHCRARSMCRRSASSIPARCRRAIPSRSPSGPLSAGAAPWSARCSARLWSMAPRAGSPRPFPKSGCSSWALCSC